MKQVRYTKDFIINAGEYTYGIPTVLRYENNAKLFIGKFCSIADGVVIFLGGEHRTDWITTYPFSMLWEEAREIKDHPSTKGDVIIENDVWIGRYATILSGVTIGSGACIGAKSFISCDVPPYSVFVG